MFPQFTAIRNNTHEARRFNNAEELAIWLLGKDADDYLIIKCREIKIPLHGREISNVRRFLENV